MLTLLKNASLYAPQPMGLTDILMAGGKIAALGADAAAFGGLPEVTTLDAGGQRVVPGLIDLHIHITGGGGEQGPVTRVPELQLTDLTLNGVTTVLAMLGTDSVTRSLEALVAKCRALNEEGVTCFCLTGAYQYPSPTLMGGAERDIALLDAVVGVKVAMADHRSSNMTAHELIRLGSDARLGGLIGGKPGLVVIHVGTSKRGLGLLMEALEGSDIPVKTFLPTHCGRSEALISEAVAFTRMGGTFDVTAHPNAEHGDAAHMIGHALKLGADPTRITLSSDAFGSAPRFDAHGVCIGLTYGTPDTLMAEVRSLVHREGLPLETALLFLTKNPARVLELTGVKGQISVGADADLVILDDALTVRTVFAGGKLAVRDGIPVMKGRFEV